MLKKIFKFLQYDEVTLFCLNYSFLLVVLLELYTQRDLDILINVAFNPVAILILFSIPVGLYYSIKHLYSQSIKHTNEIFMMVGGGALLAVCVALMTALDAMRNDVPFEIYFPAIYTILYNLLILWFMGLFDGLEIAEEFMDDRDAGRIEALVCTGLISALAIFLSLVLEWHWWHTINACVFYALSANKLVMWLIERIQQRRGKAA